MLHQRLVGPGDDFPIPSKTNWEAWNLSLAVEKLPKKGKIENGG